MGCLEGDTLGHVESCGGDFEGLNNMFSQEEAMDHKEPEGPAKQEDDLIEEAAKASPNGAKEEEQLTNMESNFKRTI